VTDLALKKHNGRSPTAPTTRPTRTARPVATRRTSVPEPDFRALFEAAPGLFLVLLPDLTIVAVSDAYASATMTRRDEIVGRGLFDVFPDNPDDPAATGVGNLRASLDRVRSALVADTMAVQKYDIRRPEDEGGGYEVRYWSPVNMPVLNSDGELTYIIHRVEDVTEFVRLKKLGAQQQRITAELRSRTAEMEADVYRRSQEIASSNRELHRTNVELHRSESFLDSLIENLPNMVFVKDAEDLRFVRFNRAGEDLLGYPRAALVGKNDYDFFPKDEADFFTTKDREVLSSGQLVDIAEEVIDTAYGQKILHTKKIPIRDEAGRPVYLLGISEDITERKQADDLLDAARAEADRANRAKTEFLSRMSHELRTPLNAILGFSQLLALDKLSDEQRSYVGYIDGAGRDLLELINEVLDLSRVEAGAMAVATDVVPVGELIIEVTALVRPLAHQRGIEIDASSPGAEVTVVADRQRVKQVLLNLVTNAVKYNETKGRVTVRCGPAGERLRITVKDTGPGIASELVDRLFRPFERLDADARQVEGTGIGLALAKGLVEAMGGTIGVESSAGAGSAFWVELPAVRAPAMRRPDGMDATAHSGDETPAAVGAVL
jgi:PAS domain S-box-containing protein